MKFYSNLNKRNIQKISMSIRKRETKECDKPRTHTFLIKLN